MKLENWSIVNANSQKFVAPEDIGAKSCYLEGYLYGALSTEDGCFIKTEQISKIQDDKATTILGGIYTLGKPCGEFADFVVFKECAYTIDEADM